MQLYQKLNAALREREMQAMRLQLEALKQDLESKLEFQATTDVLKSSEIQDLRNQLQKLQTERDRMAKKIQSQTKSVPKANNVASTKGFGRAVQTVTGSQATAKTVSKAPSGVVNKNPFSVVKREPQTKSAIQGNNITGGVKWSTK